jgi:hypothetical protein
MSADRHPLGQARKHKSQRDHGGEAYRKGSPPDGKSAAELSHSFHLTGLFMHRRDPLFIRTHW